MLDYAIRSGVNYFDTAYIYHSEVPFQAGMSEVFLGKALKRELQRRAWPRHSGSHHQLSACS